MYENLEAVLKDLNFTVSATELSATVRDNVREVLWDAVMEMAPERGDVDDLEIMLGTLQSYHKALQELEELERSYDSRYQKCEGVCDKHLPREELDEDNVCESCNERLGLANKVTTTADLMQDYALWCGQIVTAYAKPIIEELTPGHYIQEFFEQSYALPVEVVRPFLLQFYTEDSANGFLSLLGILPDDVLEEQMMEDEDFQKFVRDNGIRPLK